MCETILQRSITMGLGLLVAIVLIAFGLDWWDKNSYKIDAFFDNLPNLLRRKPKD